MSESGPCYTAPNKEKGEFFEKAEAELREVAAKHGFSLRLVDDCRGTWYFYPEVNEGWHPPLSSQDEKLLDF